MKINTDEHKYDDIIQLPHHVSSKHPQMSIYNRSAQFAPFAALTGYEEAIGETQRLTEQKAELNEDAREELDTKLRIIKEHLDEFPLVRVTCFVADSRKSGGEYCDIEGKITKFNSRQRELILDNGMSIEFDNIMDIDSSTLFREM